MLSRLRAAHGSAAASDRRIREEALRHAGAPAIYGPVMSKRKQPRAFAPVPIGRSDGPYWIHGLHAVRAALGNPERRRLRVLATDPALIAGSPEGGPALEVVKREELDRILPGSVHQGIALLTMALPEPDFEEAAEPVPGQPNRIVVLDQVTDPRNVGAVLRSAAAFAARCVVLTHRHAPSEAGALAKAASGGLEVTPLVRVSNLARALDRLGALGYWRIGFDAEARDTLPEVDLAGNVALVLGAEGEGLRRLTGERCDRLVRLPMASGGVVDSLNVAAAAAIALYAAYNAG